MNETMLPIILLILFLSSTCCCLPLGRFKRTDEQADFQDSQLEELLEGAGGGSRQSPDNWRDVVRYMAQLNDYYVIFGRARQASCFNLLTPLYSYLCFKKTISYNLTWWKLALWPTTTYHHYLNTACQSYQHWGFNSLQFYFGVHLKRWI